MKLVVSGDASLIKRARRAVEREIAEGLVVVELDDDQFPPEYWTIAQVGQFLGRAPHRARQWLYDHGVHRVTVAAAEDVRRARARLWTRGKADG